LPCLSLNPSFANVLLLVDLFRLLDYLPLHDRHSFQAKRPRLAPLEEARLSPIEEPSSLAQLLDPCLFPDLSISSNWFSFYTSPASIYSPTVSLSFPLSRSAFPLSPSCTCPAQLCFLYSLLSFKRSLQPILMILPSLVTHEQNPTSLIRQFESRDALRNLQPPSPFPPRHAPLLRLPYDRIWISVHLDDARCASYAC
jgi:hypothetical protein